MLHFPIVFLWIPYGLPMALLWLSYGFPTDSQSKAKPEPDRLAQALGSMFIVENKRGGGGRLRPEAVNPPTPPPDKWLASSVNPPQPPHPH